MNVCSCILLCELISKVLDVEYVTRCFSLIFPFFTVSIKDTIAKKFRQRAVKFGSFQIIFEIAYYLITISKTNKQTILQWSIIPFRKYSTFCGSIVMTPKGLPATGIALIKKFN